MKTTKNRAESFRTVTCKSLVPVVFSVNLIARNLQTPFVSSDYDSCVAGWDNYQHPAFQR